MVSCKTEPSIFFSSTIRRAIIFPDDIESTSVGRIDLRGIEDSVELYAMTRRAARSMPV